MSQYNKDGPLTEKQLARMKRQIAGAHALGGPAYSDCKGILGRPLGKTAEAWRKPIAEPMISAKLAKWWSGVDKSVEWHGMWKGTHEDRARAERDCHLAPQHCFHKRYDGLSTCCWCPAVSL